MSAAERLRRAAVVVRTVDAYQGGELAELLPGLTEEQWDATAEIPGGVRVALAAVFDQWAWMGEWDPDFLHRVGGPETVALADAILGATAGSEGAGARQEPAGDPDAPAGPESAPRPARARTAPRTTPRGSQ